MQHPAGLSIQLFGPFSARVRGEPLPPLRSRREQWLLALLVLRAGQEVERSWIAAMLWPDSDERQGLSSLRRALTDLRSALGPEAGRLASPTLRTLRLDLDGADVDVVRFDAAIERGDRGSLEEAAALRRAALLEACVEEWVLQERQAREEQWLAALESLAAAARERGDPAAAARWLRSVVAADPLRETAQRSLMDALAAAGSYAAALVSYRDLRSHLSEELNAAPDPATIALFQQIRTEARRRAETTAAAPPAALARRPGSGSDSAVEEPEDSHPDAGPSPPGIGVHAAESPPARPDEIESAPAKGSRTPRPPDPDVPTPLNPFYGRVEELDRLNRLLAPEAGTGADPPAARRSSRLVTLTGPAGSGKTRLALELARYLAPTFGDAMWYVPLSSLSDPDSVGATILDAMGITIAAGADPLDRIAAWLRDRRAGLPSGVAGKPGGALLILDNMEHLLAPGNRPGGDGRGAGSLIRTLLERVPDLRCLVTSRQRLEVEGERVFPVLPLPTPVSVADPSPEWVLRFPSVQLFLDRAQAADPDFELTSGNTAAVAALCHRLEGIPLAIELAAAWVTTLTPGQILARLDQRFDLLVSGRTDLDPRHRSLRAALAWSDRQLGPELRRLFARLSIFRGGWTLEAAEAVCASEGTDTLEALSQLRSRSLVLTAPAGEAMRFRMLETVREYAAEQLGAVERDLVADRHAAYYLALSEDSAARLEGSEQASVLETLEAEHENLRSALAWTLHKGPAGTGASTPAGSAVLPGNEDPGLRLVLALWRFWHWRGHLTEGRQWIGAALERAPARSRERARLLAALGVIAFEQDDLETAQSCHQESLAICREVGDADGVAFALNSAAKIADRL